MGERATARIINQPALRHGLFVTLWVVLLLVAGIVQAGDLPWLAWSLGVLPAVAGFALFLGLREGAARWVALIAGEALGVTLGSTLLAGYGSPLIILAFWPIIWAALELPYQAALGILAGTTVAYLLAGIGPLTWFGLDAMAVLSFLLYLAAFSGVFLLSRSVHRGEVLETPERMIIPAPPQTIAAEPPNATTPPPPVVDDALHQDLRVARDIQVSLLLASSPRLPGWEASTSFLPARELGGDLYDFLEIDPTHWGIMIGDVSGKGIPAALHMAVARTLFRMEARHNEGPALTLASVNTSLMEQAPQGCVTLLYAHLDVTSGTFRLANAGHNYPLIVDQSVREVALDGLPLGIDQDYTFTETTARMGHGDVLVFYTDGIVEAVNEQGEYFGFERLQELLAETSIRRPRTLTRQIVRAVRAFTGETPQSDDITLVVLRRRYEDRFQEMAEVARDVLGPEGGEVVLEHLQGLNLPPDASTEDWRAAIVTMGNSLRDRWGPGPSRELIQQLFLTLEGL